ncbi:MAG: putative manganese-dependent inorganic diphosphatase [Desulfuromonadales bacterium]|nr:putative manganese-dependent inorganic diphosphatase [Desulfuromonadales bacterium]
MTQARTYVIGHRNPDSDSICSAIAYAELCRRQGRERVLPARAGTVNRQTEFILESFEQSAPVLLTDVFPRLRDILTGEPVTIAADRPLIEAMELMRRHDIRMLPVVEDDGTPLGALILKRLPEHLFLPRQGRPIRQVLTSPASIQACLQGTPLFLPDAARVELLDLYVGAMAEPTFRTALQQTDLQRVVVLTGDREEIQRVAVDFGVRMLIVTGGLPVDAALLATARERGVAVLQSPFDTATSALLARMSTPVRHLVSDDVPQVDPDDRVESLRRLLLRGSVPGALVVDGGGRLSGVATKSNLLRSSATRLILVDHNELSQAVPGADQVEIDEVIDHHRLGNFHTDAPIRFINQPLGSTCSVVAGLYRQAGLEPEPKIAGLLMAGLLSDTVLLKSPTTTDIDRELLDWLSSLAGLDPFEFGNRMFRAGSALGADADIQSLLTADFKEYQLEERRIGIGQIEVVAVQEFAERQTEFAVGLGQLLAQRQLSLAGLLVTDIVAQTSQLLVCGDADLVEQVGYPRLGPQLFELKGVLSRKKQLMPHLLKTFKTS